MENTGLFNAEGKALSIADVMAMLPTDRAKYYCKLIGCSGLRKECLDGDVNCNILKPFFKDN